MIRVLFICNAIYRIPDQIQFAMSLSREEFEPIFLYAPEIPAESMKKVREAGFEILGMGLGGTQDAAPVRDGRLPAPPVLRWLIEAFKASPLRKVFPKSLKDLVLRSTPAQWLLYRKLYNRMRVEYLAAVCRMADRRIDVVLATGDRHGHTEGVYLKAAKVRNIPVILPYLAYSDQEGIRDQRKANPMYLLGPLSSLFYRWMFWKMPGQVLRGVSYYIPFEAAAYAKFGCLPTNPWAMGCGLSDFVCLDSLHTFNRYKSYGVQESKLRIVGDVAFDILHAGFSRSKGVRAEIAAKYGIDPAKKTLLISLPQLAEHDYLPWDVHFEIIEFIMETLRQSGHNILISLHPKMDRSRYAYLEDKYSASILSERLYQALPACDLFIATFSSTVTWAILCGIPAVVVDFYKLEMKMFDFLRTPCIVSRKEDLADAVEAPFENPLDFSEDWESLSRSTVFDGKTQERYGNLIRESVRSSQT
jgi:Alpha-2,8-polysialyltransferase (POLYST)